MIRKTKIDKDLTEGNILKALLLFSFPMIMGNLLQQIYNISDTMVVGRFLGTEALAAVGASYTLMTFLISVIMGLCMGSGSVFSIEYGAGNKQELKKSMWVSFWVVGLTAVIINVMVILFTDPLLKLLQIPKEVHPLMYSYLRIIFMGIMFTFLYNYFSCVLRAVGNSLIPLCFLTVSSILNILLDLWFVVGLRKGVEGAATATVVAQALAGIGIAVYTIWKIPELRIKKSHMKLEKKRIGRIIKYSFLTCAQQSVMNFGILMIQGLVNSFGTVIMAAFTVAVKIDTLAYMPAQEFGNACSFFISQNYGAQKYKRVQKSMKQAITVSIMYCIMISVLVYIFAGPLMELFLSNPEPEIIKEGIHYLHIEGSFYLGIGCLFLWYGFYRGIERPIMSLILTVVSLGTRVFLAYLLAPIPEFGVSAIWWAIPVGWMLADMAGYFYYRYIGKGPVFEKNMNSSKEGKETLCRK